MAFLLFLIPVAALVGGVFWNISANETKINEYFQQNQCTNIVLHRSEYKAVCKDKVIIIDDFFFLDFDNNREFFYKDIASAERLGRLVILHNKEVELNEAEPRTYFGTEKNAEAFAKGINAKVTH